MDGEDEVMDSSILGAVIVGVVNLLAMVASYGSLRQEVRDMREVQTERHAENGRRLERIESAIGITPNGAGNGIFVRQRECYLMEKAVQVELAGIKDRLTAIENTLIAIEKN